VDAASRTKVEDTRELLDNVQYAPTRGRYKVYLIDEVHMLSGHSFNALLKTLEEPPPHVKFLLATTDPQKLPVTILSRCLQFNLRRLGIEQIQDYLQKVLTAEGIDFEATALLELARAADGSMRDALSLMDQAIAYTGARITQTDVRAMLGTIERHEVYDLLDALAADDSSQVLEKVRNLAEQSPDYHEVLVEMLSCLHHVALLQQWPEAYDMSMGEQARLLQLCQQLSPEDVQLYYQMALHGRRDLSLAPDPRTGLEMTVLRMLAFRPVETVSGTPREEKKTAAVAAPKPVPSPPVASAHTSTVAVVETVAARADRIAEPAPEPEAEPRIDISPAPVGDAAVLDDWQQLMTRLGTSGVVKQLAMNCSLLQQEPDRWQLALDPNHQHLLTPERQARLQEDVAAAIAQDIKLHIEIATPTRETPAARLLREAAERQAQAQAAIRHDDAVQHLVEAFGATIKPDSVQPQ
ncbi:MAG: DNA polymerase III subunit gamma/tau, partial [Gammaproteobacteria bacterium]